VTRPAGCAAGRRAVYGTFETSDGKYLAIGSIEPQFYALLIEKLGVDRKFLAAGYPRSRIHWPEAEAAVAAAVRTKTRDEWAAIFEGTDACVAPVLSLSEAARHPHNVARGSFVTVNGVEQHAPAPRFSGPPPRRSRRRIGGRDGGNRAVPGSSRKSSGEQAVPAWLADAG
jgi:alpha-methylacyl-CoA racemase